MSTKNDGGLAFPLVERGPNGESSVSLGMSLRDYFAAKAMQAAATGCMQGMSKQGVASWAYDMADAMLKAREA